MNTSLMITKSRKSGENWETKKFSGDLIVRRQQYENRLEKNHDLSRMLMTHALCFLYILSRYFIQGKKWFLYQEFKDSLNFKFQDFVKKTPYKCIIKNFYNLEKFLSTKDEHTPLSNSETLNEGIQELPLIRRVSRQKLQAFNGNGQGKESPIKIIPPAGWVARSSDYSTSIENFIIPGPIEQNTYGKGGVYQCLHIQKKSLSYKQYRKKTVPFDKLTQGKSPQDVQDLFWKNIAFSPPLYGADIQISLMQPCSGSWNLGKLQSLLTYSLESPIKGVNTPYCYVGSWKTLFCWHTEDLQLSAINYLHDGKSKFWYSIPQYQHHIIEKQAKSLFSEHFSKCSEHLRHKTTVINPYYLKSKYPELQITKAEHKAGQFILVFGGAYHCGFNFGFNLAQAVNYATLSWLKQFATAKSCKCHNDSVKINQVSVLECLQNSIFKNAKEVHQFRQLISDSLLEEDESQTMAQKDAIKKVFKKIAKSKKSTKKLTYKGQKYDIDNWFQCDKCNKWRRTGKILQNKSKFYCNMINTNCKVKEEQDPEFITI